MFYIFIICLLCIWYVYSFYKERQRVDHYIILELVIPNDSDKGGFAWHLHMVQSGIYLARKYRKKLFVWFNDGYYYDKRVGPNWWEYYFTQPYTFTDSERNFLVECIKDRRMTEILDDTFKKQTRPYLMTNFSFQYVVRPHHLDWSVFYKYIHLNEVMSTAIDQFVSRFFGDEMVGVHYRGTDKYPSNGDGEDVDDGHMRYDIMISEVDKYIRGSPGCRIFVASDEQPFVDSMRNHFGNKIVTYDSARSTLNTSGLDLGETYECTLEDDRKECKRYFDIVKNYSIHRGENGIHPYKKGYDAVMDIYLLSRCGVMFRNADGGNFSSQPKRINPGMKLYSYKDKEFVLSD
jgi:hypothetical protein